MPSVGPELPPNLKRKRTPSSTSTDEARTSRPHRPITGATLPPPQNPDEVALESSSEDEDEDPSRVASKPSTSARAPNLIAHRVLGPTAPPAPLSELPSQSANDDSSSDDDDFGPSLPPAAGSSAAAALLAQQEADAQQAIAHPSTKSQRAEWMLVPPTPSDWTSRVDPTKLKNRKFASGKGAMGSAKGREDGAISAVWTETPEEKRRRLEDEVLGRKEVSTVSHRGSSRDSRDAKEEREDDEKDRRIKEYNGKIRGKSLAEQWKEKKGKEEEDDPSTRNFDREKDMALGGRVGHVQKREMLSKAAAFGDRFQKGRYL